jgi:hypothetical protein
MQCQNTNFDFGIAWSLKKFFPAGVELTYSVFNFDTNIDIAYIMEWWQKTVVRSTLLKVLKKSTDTYEALATSYVSL